MIKLKDLLNEDKLFGSSVTYSEQGIPFQDGITPELKKEAENYIKDYIKSLEWKWKSWAGKDDPRIIKKGTRDAYLFGFAITECKSKILGKSYPLEFDIKWKPNMKTPEVGWSLDALSSALGEKEIAPKLKKWFMEISPEKMPKDGKKLSIRTLPYSFFEPFFDDTVLTYYCGGNPDLGEGEYRVLEVFEICYKLYYDEWKKQYPNIFQTAMNKIKGMFEETDSIKLKDLLNEGPENNSRIIKIAQSNNKAEIKKLKDVLLNADWTEKEVNSAVKKRKEITKKEEDEAEAKRLETADAIPRKMSDWSYEIATDKKWEKAREDWKKKYGTKKWTTSSYNKWIKDVASAGGKAHSYDMAQNAKNEKGLLAFVQKQIKDNYGDETPLERIQWDIEAS